MKIDSLAHPGCHWSQLNKCLISSTFILGTALFYACGVKGWGLVGWIRLYCPSLTARALSLTATYFFPSRAHLFPSSCVTAAPLQSARSQSVAHLCAARMVFQSRCHCCCSSKRCRSVWTLAMTSETRKSDFSDQGKGTSGCGTP